MNYIKDENGLRINEIEVDDNYIIEKSDGSMIGVKDFREGVAAVIGTEYLDCETAETEWHLRLAAAKKIGLMLITFEDDDSIIVYDERIGKIAYSYTDPNPDYKIPINPKLIRVETDETFLLTLAKLSYITIWEKKQCDSMDYADYLLVHDINEEIQDYLRPFENKKQTIPLHERM